MRRWLFLLPLALAFVAPARADSRLPGKPWVKISSWRLNDSIVTLFADGNHRQFGYSIPGPSSGAHPGNLVFDGIKKGSMFIGVGYEWSLKCELIRYDAYGAISNDGRTVTIHALAPARNENCVSTGHENLTLVFNYIDPNTSAPVANETPGAANGQQQATFNTEIPYTGDLVVCLLPVPRAIKNLGLLAQSRPETSQAASDEASYLLAQYCRTVTNPTFAAVGQSEPLGDYCRQMSGVLKGDQVYWTICNPRYDEQE